MVSLRILAVLSVVSCGLCGDTTELSASGSHEFGLGYGLAYPYLGWGGLANYGADKGFALPLFNYVLGGLGYGGYGYGGSPYGFSNVLLGHSYGQPYGSSYYSHPYGSSYFNGPTGAYRL